MQQKIKRAQSTGTGRAAPPFRPARRLTRLADEWMEGPMIRIVLGESNFSTAELLALALDFSGLDVVHARSGLSVLERARLVHPHLILANVQLPELGGCEVCRVVRADQQLIGTKVVLYGSPDEGDVDWRGAGADAFLRKPFNIRRIAGVLMDVIGAEASETIAHELRTSA
jgi:two-component system cell cycle response regulator DivK